MIDPVCRVRDDPSASPVARTGLESIINPCHVTFRIGETQLEPVPHLPNVDELVAAITAAQEASTEQTADPQPADAPSPNAPVSQSTETHTSSRATANQYRFVARGVRTVVSASIPSSEFAFELRTCRWAEREWQSAMAPGNAVLVARQLGTKRRRWDTIVLECDPDALERRANFGAKRLDGDLLHVVRNAPAEWTYYRDALPHPGYPWRYVREAIHRAADRGILETRKDGNRIQIRRKWAYPDWVERIVAIENKPDLDASAARVLGAQLEYDVAMALADEVWVATRQTGERVEPVLLEDLPIEAGVLALDPDALAPDIAWYPRSLAVDEPGTRILERPDDGDRGGSAARFEYVDPDEKARKRLAIAERAYERGWRSFVDTMRPDCRYFELEAVAARGGGGSQLLPRCTAKGRCQTAAECSGSCPDFQPEPPAWRTKGWPIEGGPGKRSKALLAARRRRRRPGLSAPASNENTE